MVNNNPPAHGAPVPQGLPLKMCPWCGGAVAFEPNYPVTRLIPGEVRRVDDDQIPDRLRTVAAWVCETPHCRFRSPA